MQCYDLSNHRSTLVHRGSKAADGPPGSSSRTFLLGPDSGPTHPLIIPLANRYISTIYGTDDLPTSGRTEAHLLRRPLTLLALGLFLFGLEVATGGPSLVVARLWTGSRALVAGDEFLLSASRYVIGLALTLGGMAVYGALLWADLARKHITAEGSVCPNCGTHARRVRRRGRHRVLSRVIGASVTRRRCEHCGWSGLTT